MRNNKIYLLIIFSIIGIQIFGANISGNKQTDTTYNLEKVVIIESPKENRLLRQQPISVSLLSSGDMFSKRIYSMKDLNSYVPNLYIPKYGSRLTSSIYIRGIGARINNSPIGLYIDDIPYLNKSSFDIDYSDVERIDVLRGPQGTLFGVNAMGGIINIHTKSPFSYQGTDLILSAATNNDYRGSIKHYHRISEKFAFSAGGFVDYKGGQFVNKFNDKRIDEEFGGGGRIYLSYLPSSRWKINLNLNYEYVDAGGFPYGQYNPDEKTIAQPQYNFDSDYRRSLFNSGLVVSYKLPNLTLTSISGFQNLDDRMKMDQDYSEDDLYTLKQYQKQYTISQEFSAKSKVFIGSQIASNWHSTTGVSGSYQHLITNAPMSFGTKFIENLQAIMDNAMIHLPIKVLLTSERMDVPGYFKSPTNSFALYHQSVFEDIASIPGLSLTLGLRFDLQHSKISYDTHANLEYNTMRGPAVISQGEYFVHYKGHNKMSSKVLLPRLSLKYDFESKGLNGNVYLLASKGYRGGGFNLQMLSDYMSYDVQKNQGVVENDETLNKAIEYKPEYMWNYEIGWHLSFLSDHIQVDGSLFYMRLKDQQIARFVESGMGRYTANAGKTRSRGFELSVNSYITDSWRAEINYGFTDAKFTAHDNEYIGNKVPFSPINTFNLGSSYSFNLSNSARLTLMGDYCGMGKIYFTESNSVYQHYYYTLNARAAVDFSINNSSYKSIEIALWGNNILNNRFKVFYFDTAYGAYAQKNNRIQCGVDLRFKF